MGCGVDAPGHARHHQKSGRAQIRRQHPGEPLPGGRGDPCPHDGNGGVTQKPGISGQPKDRRGRLRRRQHRRIVRITEHHQPGTGARTGSDLVLGVGAGYGPKGEQAAPAAGQVGQGLEGPSGGSEPLQQGVEGNGTDLLGTGKSQAVDAFVCVQSAQGWLAGSATGAAADLAPILGSWPASRRRILGSWRT